MSFNTTRWRWQNQLVIHIFFSDIFNFLSEYILILIQFFYNMAYRLNCNFIKSNGGSFMRVAFLEKLREEIYARKVPSCLLVSPNGFNLLSALLVIQKIPF